MMARCAREHPALVVSRVEQVAFVVSAINLVSAKSVDRK